MSLILPFQELTSLVKDKIQGWSSRWKIWKHIRLCCAGCYPWFAYPILLHQCTKSFWMVEALTSMHGWLHCCKLAKISQIYYIYAEPSKGCINSWPANVDYRWVLIPLNVISSSWNSYSYMVHLSIFCILWKKVEIQIHEIFNVGQMSKQYSVCRNRS